MKAVIEEINTVQRRVKVELTSEIVNKEFDVRYRKVQQKAQLKGFRPGKAPISMIRKLYGASVSGEVAEALINRHLFSALQDHSIRPVASPMVENMELPVHDQPFLFSAIVDIMPEVNVTGYKDLKLTCERFDVTDASIDREIKFLRRRHAQTKPLDDGTPVANGQLLHFGHKVFKDDGSEVAHMNVKDFSIAVGEGEIFPELEKALIGMKKGETKKVDITLPEQYNDPELAGKKVAFELTVNNVLELVLPELNDEFAKDCEFTSMTELKADIEKNLKSQAERSRFQRLEQMILEKLSETNQFDVPPSMVDNVIDAMIEDLGIPDKKERDKMMADKEMRERFLPSAKKKARSTMILWRVSQQENINVNDDDVREYYTKMLAHVDAEKRNTLIDSFIRSGGDRVKNELIFNKALQLVIDQSKIEDIPTVV